VSETYGRTDMHSCGCTEDADGYVTLFCARHRAETSKPFLDVLDEFCVQCVIGDCGSCDGGPCQCDHGLPRSGKEA